MLSVIRDFQMRVFRWPVIVSVGRGLNHATETTLKHDWEDADKN